jgi:predicted MFS family arabinose efflux permease
VNSQDAFAPGSPAGGPSITDKKTMTLPPLQFSSTANSSAKGGDISQSMGVDNSGFNVNYGAGASLGGSLPSINPLIIGAVVLLGALWIKKST